MSNFYKGFVFARTKDRKVYLIKENLKQIKEIQGIDYLSFIDNNGLMLNQGLMINYEGEVIILESVNKIYRKNAFFYKINLTNYIYQYFDRTGKVFSDSDTYDLQDTYFFEGDDFFYFAIYSNYYYYFYDYDGNYLGSSKDGLSLDISK